MFARKEGLMEELVVLCEIRGEGNPDQNSATENRIKQIEAELNAPDAVDDAKRFNIWIAGYNVNRALYVEMVAETPKAFKFRALDSLKEYTFFLPKKACRFDKNVQGVINLANWFTIDGFFKFLVDRYASVYNR